MNAPEAAPEFSRTAPPTLTPPDELISEARAQDRDVFIMNHGFTNAELKPDWWKSHGIDIELPSNVDDEDRLTRGDLFELGASAESEKDVLNFVWHVLAWGSGSARRNNVKRIEHCGANVGILREAILAAREGDARAAYTKLIPAGTVPYLRPAFFSKILYFASDKEDPRCLILDARVARSMYRLGWSMAPSYPSRTFFFNWYSDTYVSYCEQLRSWGGGDTRADVFERLLFAKGNA